MDFGGSEFQEASTTLLNRKRNLPRNLTDGGNSEPGHYLIKFNEKIALKNLGLILSFLMEGS